MDNVSSHSSAQTGARIAWYALAVGTVVFLLQWLYWRFKIQAAFYPTGDDFALLVHSTRYFAASPVDWFRHGFAEYFHPYPDLSVPSSNMLRPLDNALMYFMSLAFADRWSAYLLLNYALAASLCATVFAWAWAGLELSLPMVALTTLAGVVSPAYTYHMLYRPSFAFDYLGALCGLLCALCLIRQRPALAWLFAMLAVLSKESAYYVPIAAGIALWLGSPRQRSARGVSRALVFLLPLIFVTALRLYDFPHPAGVTMLHGLTPFKLVKSSVIGLTQWPYMLPGEQHITERSLHNLTSLALAFTVWVLMAAALWTWFLRSPQRVPAMQPDRSNVRRTLLVFLLASCGVPILFNLGPRFGASTYPLLALLLAAIATNASFNRRARTAALVVLLAMTAIDLSVMRTTFAPHTLQQQLHQWALSRSLVQQLRADNHSVRFLLPDVSEAYSSPEIMRRFVGTPGRIIPVNTWQVADCPNGYTPELKRTGATYTMSSTLPPRCGVYDLFATTVKPGHSTTDFVRTLPEATITYHAPASAPETFAWQAVRIDITPLVPSYAILVPDSRTDQFRVAAVSEDARPSAQ